MSLLIDVTVVFGYKPDPTNSRTGYHPDPYSMCSNVIVTRTGYHPAPNHFMYVFINILLMYQGLGTTELGSIYVICLGFTGKTLFFVNKKN